MAEIGLQDSLLPSSPLPGSPAELTLVVDAVVLNTNKDLNIYKEGILAASLYAVGHRCIPQEQGTRI